MPSKFLVMLALFALYSGGSYILARKLYLLLNLKSIWSKSLYGLVMVFLFFSFFLARLGSATLPLELLKNLSLLGGYVMGSIFYGILVLMLAKILSFLHHRRPFLPKGLTTPKGSFLASLLAVVLLLSYGSYKASHAVIQQYDLTIPKQAGLKQDWNIVFVSDVHLGIQIDQNRLKQLVQEINSLNPDLILIGGDLIDGDYRPFAEENMGQILQQLKAPFGVYAIMGNHEYYGSSVPSVVQGYETAGLRLLRDESAIIDNSLILIGRDDQNKGRYVPPDRQKLTNLTKDLNPNLPWLVLDHQPFQLTESAEAGTDLQLSGHTHEGQTFPNNWITRFMYEKDWGYLKKGSFQLIVSSGYGYWGPPLRIGTQSEIVQLHLHVTGKE